MGVQVRNVTKTFTSRRGPTVALQRLNFEADSGEFVALVGPSGCGKSTLLRLLAGLSQPDEGAITFTAWTRPPQRAMVFQDASLLPWLRVVDNVAFGLEAQGVPSAVRRQRAVDLLQRMGLGAQIWLAWQTLRLQELYATLAVISLVGFMSHRLLNILARWLLPWQAPAKENA